MNSDYEKFEFKALEHVQEFVKVIRRNGDTEAVEEIESLINMWKSCIKVAYDNAKTVEWCQERMIEDLVLLISGTYPSGPYVSDKSLISARAPFSKN